MDIKQTKPSLSQEASAALNPKSGFSDLPSLMSQFTIRTMEGDLKSAAPIIQTSPVAPVSTPPLPAKPVVPVVAAAPHALPRDDKFYGDERSGFYAAAPAKDALEKIAKETLNQTAETTQKKLAEEKSAAEKAAKKAQEKLAEKKEAAEKIAAAAAKEKLRKEKEEQKKELRDIFDRAKFKMAAKEFDAAIVDAQKIVASPIAGWIAKWRAKSLINKAQKIIDKKNNQSATILAAPISLAPPIPPKPATAPANAALKSAPVNLPTIDEIFSPKPVPPAAPRDERPASPAPAAAPLAPRRAEPLTVPQDEQSKFNKAIPPAPPVLPALKPAPSPALPRDDSPKSDELTATAPMPKPTPAKPAFQNLIANLPTAQTEEPAEVLDMKKVALAGIVFIAVLALIVWGLWFFLKQPSAPVQVSQSPSPRPSSLATQTPTPAPSPLFRADSQKVFALKTNQEKANFQEAMLQLSQTDESAGNFVYAIFKDNSGVFPSLTRIASFAEIDLFDLPTQISAGPLKNQLDMNSFSFFAYSQAQINSSPFTAQINTGRLGLIISIKNSTATSTEDLTKTLRDLEQLMLADLAILLPSAKNDLPAKPVFLDNVYKNTAIRYVNLPEASLSLDWAIVNDKLIFATSKESVYAIIDRLLSPNSQPTASPLMP